MKIHGFGLMLLKALGYFQYSADFGSDWLVETTKNGSTAGLFDGVATGAKEALTRNDVDVYKRQGLPLPLVSGRLLFYAEVFARRAKLCEAARRVVAPYGRCLLYTSRCV